MILKQKRKNWKEENKWIIRSAIVLFWICFFVGITFLLMYLRTGQRMWDVWNCRTREDIYYLVTNLITSFSFSVTGALTYQKIRTFIILKRKNSEFKRKKRK